MYCAATMVLYSGVMFVLERNSIQMPTFTQLVLILLSGFFGLLMQNAYVWALKYETPSMCLFIQNLSVIYSLIGDWFIFDFELNFPTIFGSILVIGSFGFLLETKKIERNTEIHD